jgi:beta-glucosidase
MHAYGPYLLRLLMHPSLSTRTHFAGAEETSACTRTQRTLFGQASKGLALVPATTLPRVCVHALCWRCLEEHSAYIIDIRLAERSTRMNEKIEALISQMTLEEKISLLAGADLWHTVPLERLGIPVMKMTDGPFGARGVDNPSSPTSACFPCGTALGATWNPELVERVGKALAEETKSKGAHILLGPTVNIHRSPLAGRNFESFSEDPYLSGRMAVAYITGLQHEGVGACIKHFVCNDSEFERQSISSEVDERALREIYLRPFQMAVREAKPWAVMSAYNRINGAYASENPYLLLDILKGEWSFDGIVISDWFGTYGPNVARGGLDLEMPGPARWMGQKALDAVQRDEVSEEVINDKVRRLLRTLIKAGVFKRPELCPEQAIDLPEHRRLARQAAAEAIVLLKNSKSILPLELDKVKSIAVIGESAKWASVMGGGSVRVSPHYVVSPLEAIQNRVSQSVQVGYAIGCTTHKNPPLFDKTWLNRTNGGRGLTVEYFANGDLAGKPVFTETTDKMELIWFGDNQLLDEPNNFSARLTGTFTVPENEVYVFHLASVGKSRLFIDGKRVIDQWDGVPVWESKTQNAKVELAKGQSYQLRVEYACEPGPRWRHLRIGCMREIPADSIAQAVVLAAKSDAAIIFAGLTPEWEGEGADRSDMKLPGEQTRLIEQVAAANPNTIVVLNAGAPLSMNWLDQVAAVLQAWYLGQETGNAVVDVLFGEVNPSGRLPMTFPKRLQDNPAYINYPGESGKVHYGEGLYVGYRYYDKKDIAPLFPFGYGLSYTTFAYRNLEMSATEYAKGDVIRMSVEVENTGKCRGQEIVQVYVRDLKSHIMRPEKELKAFSKITLEPGQVRQVTLVLDEEALSYYDPGLKRWVVEAGEFEVLVGSSSRDIRLTTSFNFKGEPSAEGKGQDRLHTGMPLKTLLDEAKARAVLEKYIAPFLADLTMEQVSSLSLDQLSVFVPSVLTPELLRAINENLRRMTIP